LLPRLDGRRLWFAGIGGAGLSGYALLAHAWGAEVSGWDRAETSYLAHVRAAGIPVVVTGEPGTPPQGAEVVVSSAYAGLMPGRSRAEFLAELVSLQPSIVVAGAHGKTTTTAMIAFCLDRLGLDPGFLVGAEVPQLGANARAGGGWLIVEGDESDGTVALLRPRIGVVTNVDLDHHASFAARAEVEELLEDWLREVPLPLRCDELEPADLELAVPGEHNRRNAACALAALELAGVTPAEARPVLAAFRGAGRRFEPRGEAGGVRVFDDYGHHPTEVAATIAAARELGDGRVHVLFQPHLPSRTRHLARAFGTALAAADSACVTEIYLAREEPLPGVSGKLIVDALTEARSGMPVGWTPRIEDGAVLVAGRARRGDAIVTMGAGDVDRAVPLLLARLGA